MFSIRPSNINLKNWFLSRAKITPLCLSFVKKESLSTDAIEDKGITDGFRKLGVWELISLSLSFLEKKHFRNLLVLEVSRKKST